MDGFQHYVSLFIFIITTKEPYNIIEEYDFII